MSNEPFLVAPTAAPTATGATTDTTPILGYPGIPSVVDYLEPLREEVSVENLTMFSWSTYRDTLTFFDTWTGRLQLGVLESFRDLTPSPDQIKAALRSSPTWLMFGGHMLSGYMFNDYPGRVEPYIRMYFDPGGVRLEYGFNSPVEEIKKGQGFELHQRIKVSIWRGCSVFLDKDRLRTIRALLGPHTILGFDAGMGWKMTEILFGGSIFTPKGSPIFADDKETIIGYTERDLTEEVPVSFFDMIEGKTGDEAAIRDAWLKPLEPLLVTPEAVHDNITRFKVCTKNGEIWGYDRYDRTVKQMDRL